MKNIYFLSDRDSKLPDFYFDTLIEISDFFEEKNLIDFDLNFLEKIKKEKALLIFLENRAGFGFCPFLSCFLLSLLCLLFNCFFLVTCFFL